MPYRKAAQDYAAHPYIPSKDPLTAIPPSRHPFQFWSMIACILGGIGNVFTAESTINTLVPRIMVVIWALSLITGGALALVGAFHRDRILGLLMERIALTSIGGGCIIYGGAILYLAGAAAAVSGPLTISIGIAAFWRLVHVNRELNILHAFMAGPMSGNPS